MISSYIAMCQHTATYLLTMCCFIQISAEFNITISTFCSGGTNIGDQCGIAGAAIDDACLTSLGLEDNMTCTGSCGSQLATAAAACTTSVSCKIAVHVPI